MHDSVHDLAMYVASVDFRGTSYVHHLSLTENTGLDEIPFSQLVFTKSILFPIVGVGSNSTAFLNRCMSNLRHFLKAKKNLISLQHLETTTKQRVLPEDKIANLSSLQTLRI
ncbi:unnamed protein product [Vicia faba]|uniref:Uncharacterized protein n=1 Tax=Vicia faba TaxID=3906 RepID=A0AAV0ZHF0_VICFA|nr:unnamed protein product [Vicia faba]